MYMYIASTLATTSYIKLTEIFLQNYFSLSWCRWLILILYNIYIYPLIESQYWYNFVFLKILTSKGCYGTMGLCSRERLKTFYKHAQKKWRMTVWRAVTSWGSTGEPSTYQLNRTTFAIISLSIELGIPRVTALTDTTMCLAALGSSFCITSCSPYMSKVEIFCYKSVAIKVGWVVRSCITSVHLP